MAITLATAAASVLRDAHYVKNPVTGLHERSTLIERGAVNLCGNSEDLDNGSWTKDAGVAVTANSTVSPDGTVNADTVTWTGLAGRYIRYLYATLTPENRTFVLSFYAAAGTAAIANVNVIIRRGDASESSGTAGNLWAPIGDPVNGMQRYFIVKAFGASAVGDNVEYGFTNLVDAMGTVLITGVMLEEILNVATGSPRTPSSYLKTTAGATTSRAGDSVFVPFTIPPVATTAYARFIEHGALVIFNVGKSDFTGPRMLLYVGPTGYRFTHDKGGLGARESLIGAFPAFGSLVELRAVLYADGSVQVWHSVNGAAEVAGPQSTALALAAAWTDTKAYLGGVNGNSAGVLPLMSLKFARGVQTMADMRVS